MRHSLKKAAAVAFLIFLVLWVGETIYGLTLPYPQPPALQLPAIEELSGRLPSANNLQQLGLATTPLPLVLEHPEAEKIQVHEKRAQVAAGTAAFDNDEASIRAALALHQALVFNEKTSGLAPGRRLWLEIGVNPDQFDALVEQLRQIPHLENVSVQQRDRTSEFRRLHAQQQSLKKYQEAILKLRGAANLSIDDALKLEQRMQEIEKELQTLGAQFGDLLGKESYYHVYLTLSEYQPGSKLDPTNTLPLRLLHSLLWALAGWVGVLISVVAVAGAYISIRTLWPTPAGKGTSGPQVVPTT
jgi:hypothetical protein